MDDNEKLNLLFDMTEEQQAAIGEAIAEFKRQNERLETSGGNLPKSTVKPRLFRAGM
jgi:hypothetical protein